MSKKHDIEMANKYGPFRNGKRTPWFTLDRLLEIYKQVSGTIQCEAGCRECCEKGTPVSNLEQMLIETFCDFKGYAVRTKGDIAGKCPYRTAHLCQIYPVRPFMCRVYGLCDNKELICLKGVKPDQAYFGDAETHALFAEVQYHRDKVDKIPTPEELRLAVLVMSLTASPNSYAKKETDGQEATA